MADQAFMTLYREETVAAFEQNYSLLRQCCVRNVQIKGNTAVFLVSGSGGATAVTRGTNGLIPYNTADNTQNSVTLAEYHAPYERTSFNIFASQGDQKRVMQMASVAVLNRNIDQTIINQLDSATVNTGTARTANLDLVLRSRTILGNAKVALEEEDNMFAVVTPAFDAYLMQVSEFANAQYVENRLFDGPFKRMKRWMGINWITHVQLTGVSTSSEKCYMFHKNAMGHAANSTEMDVQVGYDGKQDLSWSRATLYHGAKILQNSGIVQMVHDGSAYA